MAPSEAKRLLTLKDENAKLTRLLAEAMLDRKPFVQGQWRGALMDQAVTPAGRGDQPRAAELLRRRNRAKFNNET